MSRSLGFLIERHRGKSWEVCSVDALLTHRAVARLSYLQYTPASPVYTLSPPSELIAALLGDSVRPPLRDSSGLPRDLSADARREVAAMADPAYGEPGYVLAEDWCAYDWSAGNEDGEPSQDLQDLSAHVTRSLAPLADFEALRIVYFFS